MSLDCILSEYVVLEAAAARGRRSVADVTQELLEEALRMRQCPGSYFVEEPGFERPFPHLSRAQLTAALMYYSRYRDDVQEHIDALTPVAIERQYPGLVRFAR